MPHTLILPKRFFVNNAIKALSLLHVKPAMVATLATSLMISGCGGGDDTSDPIDVGTDIAYVDRPLYTDEDVNDEIDPEPVLANIENPREFNGGARLILRSNTTRAGSVRDITNLIYKNSNTTVDIKDLNSSPDGKKLTFAAMREPLLTQVADEQKWDIWEYDIETGAVEALITSETFAQEGHDISPVYLADNKTIIFASTRQSGDFETLVAERNVGANKLAFLSLTESGEEIDEDSGLGIGAKFNLHTLDTETQEIKQITFNRSHDLQPTLLSDGRIAFLRWDNKPDGDEVQSLFTVLPDGSQLSPLYGYHSQQSVDSSTGGALTTFFDLADLGNGQLMAVIKQQDNSLYPNFDDETAAMEDTPTNPFLGGELIRINYAQFTELDRVNANASTTSNTGQQSILGTDIDISNAISEDGYINSAYPVNDSSGKIIYSRTPCRVRNENSNEILSCEDNIGQEGIIEADPYYSLWIFDPTKNTKALVERTSEGRMITDVAVIKEISQSFVSVTASDAATGVIHIESIYDFDGERGNTPDDNNATLSELALPSDDPDSAFRQREARFIRIVKAVSEPDSITHDFDRTVARGVANGRGFLEILGYAPIEPDGSVAVKVPANVAFELDIVDRNGRRVPGFGRHNQWLSLAPGEVRHCTGCHLNNSDYPHGRRNAEMPSINTGAPSDGVFPNTGIPTEAGWTMATAFAMQNVTIDPDATSAEQETQMYSEARELSPNLLYEDEWSSVTTPEESISLRYAAANPASADDEDLNLNIPVLPSSNSCIFSWSTDCRIIINYETHIQPIWDADRILGDDNYSCSSCHTSNGNRQIAAGLLELTNNPAGNFFASYNELLTEANATITVGLAYRYRTDPDTGVQLFLQELDEQASAIAGEDVFVNALDPDGNPIPLVDTLTLDEQTQAIGAGTPILVQDIDSDGNFIFIQNSNGSLSNTDDDSVALDGTIEIPQLVAYDGPIGNIGLRMNRNNASTSRFFTVMTEENNSATFHHNRLDQGDANSEIPLINEHELRLISEWLDIGAQYYNNPFDVPTN